MAIFTQSPWVDRNDPIQFMEAGARTGLAARGQDLSQMEAGQRLRLSYDSLAAQMENDRRNQALRLGQIGATTALKNAQQDAMTQYRNQQIQDQQERLKQTAAKTAAAADALTAAHDDTAAFVTEAEKVGAAAALAKHPNADKLVVNHVMALEANKAKQPKTPVEKGAIDFPAPGQDAAANSASLIRFTGVPLDNPVINTVLGTNAPPGTGTNYVSRLNAQQADVPHGTNAPVKVASKEQRDALPPGTQYVGPDGKTYTKT